MRPDFKQFRGFGLKALTHSAKGSTWEEHKYIKRIDGTYYYPDSYEGGRHLSSLKSDSGGSDNKDSTEEPETKKLSDSDVESLALEVIRGNFGNGEVRKELLNEYYQQVQNRVNELMRGSTGSKKISEVSESRSLEEKINDIVEKSVEAVSKSKPGSSSSGSTSKGLDYETIFGVYRKKS